MIDVDWDFNTLERLIQDRGECVVHEKGITCPACNLEDPYASMVEHEGQPTVTFTGQVNCPRCFGTGFIYRDARIIKGMFTSIQSGANKQLLEGGWAVPGDAVFSPSLRECPLSDFDKITLTYAVPVGPGQTIMRGAATKGANAALRTELQDNEDRLWYRAECPIWCEDQFGRIYTHNVDYELDGHKIRWIGQQPPRGSVYTFKYRAFLEWVVFATPMTRIDRNRSLAQKVLVRKVHTVLLNSHKVDTVEKRAQLETEFTLRTEV